MPANHSWEGDRFVVRVTGVLGIADSLLLFEQFYSDQRATKGGGILFDCSECEEFDFDQGDIAHMTALEFGGSRGLPPMKIAFVGGTPELQSFYDRYLEFYETVYEKVDAQWQIELFDKTDAAQAWLDAKD